MHDWKVRHRFEKCNHSSHSRKRSVGQSHVPILVLCALRRIPELNFFLVFPSPWASVTGTQHNTNTTEGSEFREKL